MAELGAYLRAAARTPFVWGEDDCALWVAGWITLRTGHDFAAPYRGRYHTALGCWRLLRREGGLLALFERDLAGLQRIWDPAAAQAGDVGVVLGAGSRPGRLTLVAAICTGPRWAARGGACKLVVGPAPVAAAWRP